MYARSGATCPDTRSNPTTRPPLYRDAARSMVAADCFHPRMAGPKGLAMLTSSAWEYAIFKGSASPLTNSPRARCDCSTAASSSSFALMARPSCVSSGAALENPLEIDHEAGVVPAHPPAHERGHDPQHAWRLHLHPARAARTLTLLLAGQRDRRRHLAHASLHNDAARRLIR